MKPALKVLVVTDHLNATPWISVAKNKKEGSDSWSICLFGVSREVYTTENTDLLKKLKSYEFIDSFSFCENVQEDIRAFFPNLVDRLAHEKLYQEKSLLELCSRSGCNLWWYLEFTEKSAFRLPVINQLFYLGILNKVLQQSNYDEVWLCIRDSLLRKVIHDNLIIRNIRVHIKTPRIVWNAEFLLSALKGKPYVNYVLTGIKETSLLLFRRFMILVLRLYSLKVLNQKNVAIFSYYPIWWKNPFSSKASELFCGPLSAYLRNQFSLYYLTWLMINPFDLIRYGLVIKRLFAEQAVVALDSFLTWSDILLPWSNDAWGPLIGFRQKFASRIKVEYGGFDVSKLIVRELGASFSSQEIFFSLWMEKAVERALTRFKLECILYPHEYQPGERAILHASKGLSYRVGFQHALIGSNHLSYLFAQGEIKRNLSSRLNAMPIPNFFMLSGEGIAEIWTRAGYSNSQFSVVGPARFPNMKQLIQSTPENLEKLHKVYNIPVDRKVFLFILTVLWEEVRNLLGLFASALDPEVARSSFFLLKCHPAGQFERRIISMIQELQLPIQYQVISSETPMYDVMKCSNAVISSGSTACIEAMVLGISSIVYNDTSSFNVNPMVDFMDSTFAVYTARDLNQALRAIIDSNARLDHIKRSWPSVIKKVFGDFSEDPASKFTNVLLEKMRERSNLDMVKTVE